VYCGAELPPDVVEAAAAARAALEAEWARESAGRPASTAGPAPSPAPRPGAPAAADLAPPPAGPSRVLLVLELEGTSDEALAAALGLSRFEAGQRQRRGGLDLHRILPADQAAAEAARLRGHHLSVLEIAEDEVRRAEPLVVTRAEEEAGALVLEAEGAEVRLAAPDALLVVRGAIAREYPPSTEVRRVSLATLEPGYRVHLHRRADVRPLELDPAVLEFGAGGAAGGAQIQITRWLDRLLPDVPRDDSFRLVIPALAPSAPASERGASSAAAALGRPDRERRAVLDNVAQFRFHSAWRAAAVRRRAR
jgi:hypothetical protein